MLPPQGAAIRPVLVCDFLLRRFPHPLNIAVPLSTWIADAQPVGRWVQNSNSGMALVECQRFRGVDSKTIISDTVNCL